MRVYGLDLGVGVSRIGVQGWSRSRMSRFGVVRSGCGVSGAGCRVWGVGCMMKGVEIRVEQLRLV